MTHGAAEKAARRIYDLFSEWLRKLLKLEIPDLSAAELVPAIAAIITEEMERETRIEEFSCRECGGKLTPNPMEGHKNSWMHFEGRKDCKLRGKGQEYLSRTAFVAEREKERKL